MTNIIELEYIRNGFAVLGFLISFGYIATRVFQLRFQKRHKIGNMEFWVFYNLKDLYQFYGYPDPESCALGTMHTLRDAIKKQKNIYYY